MGDDKRNIPTQQSTIPSGSNHCVTHTTGFLKHLLEANAVSVRWSGYHTESEFAGSTCYSMFRETVCFSIYQLSDIFFEDVITYHRSRASARVHRHCGAGRSLDL
jgi:hypothetical protein